MGRSSTRFVLRFPTHFEPLQLRSYSLLMRVVLRVSGEQVECVRKKREHDAERVLGSGWVAGQIENEAAADGGSLGSHGAEAALSLDPAEARARLAASG